jgi:hypothetical protein
MLVVYSGYLFFFLFGFLYVTSLTRFTNLMQATLDESLYELAGELVLLWA